MKEKKLSQNKIDASRQALRSSFVGEQFSFL